VTLGVAISRGEGVPPVVHGQDAANGARVIAEEHAAEGDEQADENGGPCRASLGRRLDLDSRSWDGERCLVKVFHGEGVASNTVASKTSRR